MSGSPDRSRLLWFHLVSVYLDWVKEGGAGSLTADPPNAPLKEGTAAASDILSKHGDELLSVCKDFSYVSIRPL